MWAKTALSTLTAFSEFLLEHLLLCDQDAKCKDAIQKSLVTHSTKLKFNRLILKLNAAYSTNFIWHSSPRFSFENYTLFIYCLLVTVQCLGLRSTSRGFVSLQTAAYLPVSAPKSEVYFGPSNFSLAYSGSTGGWLYLFHGGGQWHFIRTLRPRSSRPRCLASKKRCRSGPRSFVQGARRAFFL